MTTHTHTATCGSDAYLQKVKGRGEGSLVDSAECIWSFFLCVFWSCLLLNCEVLFTPVEVTAALCWIKNLLKGQADCFTAHRLIPMAVV